MTFCHANGPELGSTLETFLFPNVIIFENRNNNNINTNGVLRWNSVDCPWILWAFYWFKILISITAIEFAINTHSMEFLGHTPWNSVDSCGQELRIPWTDSMELPPKVGTVTESIRNPYGMSTDEKMEFGWACHPKCIPQNFQNLSTDIPWNPAESMESTEFRRKRWGTVKYSIFAGADLADTSFSPMALRIFFGIQAAQRHHLEKEGREEDK